MLYGLHRFISPGLTCRHEPRAHLLRCTSRDAHSCAVRANLCSSPLCAKPKLHTTRVSFISTNLLVLPRCGWERWMRRQSTAACARHYPRACAMATSTRWGRPPTPSRNLVWRLGLRESTPITAESCNVRVRPSKTRFQNSTTLLQQNHQI